MDDRELSHLRAVPLESVLEGLGAKRDPKDPKHNWKIGGSRITLSEQQFFDHNRERGGGGAIDLVRHVTGYTFREAVTWLSGIGGVMTTERQPQRAAAPVSPPDTTEQPAPDPNRLLRVRWYLTEKRAIPEAIVTREIEGGRIYADGRGNAVFRLRDETNREIGYELRGTYDKAFHSVAGAKGLYFTGTKSGKVAAFVESGIEALSYHALKNDVLAISTTGNAIELPERMGKHLIERGYRIITAFNADRDGDRMSERLNERLNGVAIRDRPDKQYGKDWNLQLRAQRGKKQVREEPSLGR